MKYFVSYLGEPEGVCNRFVFDKIHPKFHLDFIKSPHNFRLV